MRPGVYAVVAENVTRFMTNVREQAWFICCCCVKCCGICDECMGTSLVYVLLLRKIDVELWCLRGLCRRSTVTDGLKGAAY